MSGESNSYKAFKDNICTRLDRIHRVENPIVPGMFDVNICLHPGVEFWMEIKSPTEPVRATTPLFGSNHNVSQFQINWALAQSQAGGLCFFFVDTNRRRMFIPAVHAERINSLTVSELESLSIWTSPKPTPKENWKPLSDFIRSWSSLSRQSLTSIRSEGSGSPEEDPPSRS